MDTTMGGDYTRRYTGHKEHLFHSSYGRPTLKLYKRYINDGVGASTKPKSDLEHYIQAFNDFLSTRLLYQRPLWFSFT